MNAAELLTLQRHEVDRLFERLETIEAEDSSGLRAVARRLAGHMRMEEELLYPMARGLGAGRPELERLSVAARMIERLSSAGSPASTAKLERVMGLVQHDVGSEEQMFAGLPSLRRARARSKPSTSRSMAHGRRRVAARSRR